MASAQTPSTLLPPCRLLPSLLLWARARGDGDWSTGHRPQNQTAPRRARPSSGLQPAPLGTARQRNPRALGFRGGGLAAPSACLSRVPHTQRDRARFSLSMSQVQRMEQPLPGGKARVHHHGSTAASSHPRPCCCGQLSWGGHQALGAALDLLLESPHLSI